MQVGLFSLIFRALDHPPAIAAAGVVVDLAVGDPARLPHPVVWIGKWIAFLDVRLNREGLSPTKARLCGFALALSTTAGAGILSAAALSVIWRMSPVLALAANVWLTSTTVAWRGLTEAGRSVYHPLARGDLEGARHAVGEIVGRDTDGMDDGEVARAAVETLAENIVDAVVSPVFYACLGGAPLALFYRAANTLDSMVGYKNDRYRHFGSASARLDDLLNYIPARLTGAILLLTALFLRIDASGALGSWIRDAKKHPSPNAGVPEAVVAGALGIRLGGLNRYGGVVSLRAFLGEARRPIVPEDILRAVDIVNAAGAILLAASVAWAVVQGI